MPTLQPDPMGKLILAMPVLATIFFLPAIIMVADFGTGTGQIVATDSQNRHTILASVICTWAIAGKFTSKGNTMRIQKTESGYKIWLSANDTEQWATRWPCSIIRGHRLFAEFDSNGLVDFALNGGRGNQDVPGHEFEAIISDFAAR